MWCLTLGPYQTVPTLMVAASAPPPRLALPLCYLMGASLSAGSLETPTRTEPHW